MKGRGNLRWLWLSALILVLDQATKVAAVAMLVLHRPVAIVPGFNLTLTYNTGAAFSLLREAGGWQRWLFATVAIVISIVLVVWLHRMRERDHWSAGAVALVLGGALGNLWDRIARGAVVDFLDVYYGAWHWPAFNIADSAICVGAAILVFLSFRAPVVDRNSSEPL